MTIRNHPRLAVIAALACCLSSCATPSLQERPSAARTPRQTKHSSAAIPKSTAKSDYLDFPIPLKAFSLDAIYGGKTGFPRLGHYRAKLTLYGASDAPSIALRHVAELYFYDEPEQVPDNPLPGDYRETYSLPGNHRETYYVLNFPMVTLGPILEQLRHSTVKLQLNWERTHWYIGTTPTEAVRNP